jgi:hypothetical protein
MKNIFATLCLVSILLPQTAIAATTTFSDVNENIFQHKAIQVFMSDGIISGYPDGTFKPAQPINRAEALKIIIGAFPVADEQLSQTTFSDVTDGDWFSEYVKKGISRGIINGYPDGTFKPANQINFAESLKMGLHAKGLDANTFVYSAFHQDIAASEWFAKYFKYGYDKNLYDLDLDGHLNPGKLFTRADFVELIYRIKTFSPDSTFDISYNWDSASVQQSGLKMYYPFHWDAYPFSSGIFFGYFYDGLASLVHLNSNSAHASVVFWENPENKTANEYFLNLKNEYTIKYGVSNLNFVEAVVSSGPSLLVEIPKSGIYDYFIYLKDSRILAVQSAFDKDSLRAPDFKDEIKTMFEKISFTDDFDFLTDSQKLERIRANILVGGKGAETLDLLTDRAIIETDTLGVGTGPVDYYYSSDINYTLKYERSSDIILDIKEGRTSAF